MIRARLPLLALALVAACGGDNAVAPQFEPQIVNVADDFSFQATGVDGVTQTLEYTWQNSGTLGNITQSSSLTTPAGSATLVLLAPGGVQVYSRSLTEGGTFTSSASTAGAWRVRVLLTNVSGTLNFRVQRGG